MYIYERVRGISDNRTESQQQQQLVTPARKTTSLITREIAFGASTNWQFPRGAMRARALS